MPVPAGRAAPVPNQAELSDYQRHLYDEVARHSRYPAEAKRLHLAGVTHLAFRLDRLGHLLESWVQESSGSEILDNAALDALQRAQPLSPIPPSLPAHMEFVIEIDASLLQQLALATVG
ncbi:MAG TPA: TonB family protein [Sphingobium sp.]|uniref:energy transducer TonB n=1 Tax=Sphingobium sp. TaxID=1912891 RepID=UPI002ECFB67D